jgi:hypothetical protein
MDPLKLELEFGLESELELGVMAVAKLTPN